MLQALIVLFVAAPALVRGCCGCKDSRRRSDRHGEGMGLMSAAVATDEDTAEGVVDVRDRGDVRRQIKLVVVFAVVALLLLVLRHSTSTTPTVKYILGERVTKDDRGAEINGKPLLDLPGRSSVGGAGAGAAQQACPRAARRGLSHFLVGVAFFVGFIVWCYADQTARSGDRINPFPGTIRLATPLVFGALAGCLGERAGVINIAIEGQFLDGRVLRVGRGEPGLQRGDGTGRRDRGGRRDGRPARRCSRCATTSTRWSSVSC